uniref:Formin binding protein 4 n=1 Tax=Neogobius melanostomus TaxID=47308 RepID=A0A8C6UP49_9GOBI
MGKKNRFAGGAAGRRTILQLSPPGSRGINSGETHSGSEGEFLCFVLAHEGLSLLGAYEDSDEDDAAEHVPVNSQHNKSADIDSTLADFMAEIDAITTQPTTEGVSDTAASTPPATEKNALQTDSAQIQAEPSTDAAFEYNTQYSLAGVGVEMGDWQEVWDDNSGCYYYWNTATNEVSWELPHYLADQVQIVDDQHTEEAAAEDAALTETKKEVNESVVALTNEEEERCGVAASLLGPLIPSEVKEAEEKWRKRLLKGLEETENSLDSEGETCQSQDSPSLPILDQESALSEKDVLVKKQSAENSDAEGAEEDTVELELALERKKAELRALEEGDGSAGGSSPSSETGQDATNSRSSLFKKKRWKTAFPGVPSPDSNSRGSDIPESTETALSKVIESVVQGEEKEMKAENSDDNDAAKPFQIGELANTLTSKMEFLGINKKTISNFQLLLLQTETRIADWREGALNGVYLRRRLQEAAEHIKYYELNATPKGWSCHWDRYHRRYFYMNERTGASQWDFPAEEDTGEDAKEVSVYMFNYFVFVGSSAAPSWTSSQPPLPSSPPPPLFSSSPPPPLPPDSPPTPPPLPDSDTEIMEVEMEMDDDDDGEPPAPGTEEDSGRPPLPPGLINTKQSYPLHSTCCSSSVMPVTAYWGVPPVSVHLVPSDPPIPPMPPQPPLPPPQLKKISCIFILHLLQAKKIKTKMPSLVKKWQSIQKELDEEEKSSSSDEDRDLLNKKSIEDWKYQQLMTGKASKNANFEAIPDDWRQRIKKRKMNT